MRPEDPGGKRMGGSKSEIEAGAGHVVQGDLIVSSPRCGLAASCHRASLQPVDSRREIGEYVLPFPVGERIGLEQAALHQADGHIGQAGLIGREKSVPIAVQVGSSLQEEERIVG